MHALWRDVSSIYFALFFTGVWILGAFTSGGYIRVGSLFVKGVSVGLVERKSTSLFKSWRSEWIKVFGKFGIRTATLASRKVMPPRSVWMPTTMIQECAQLISRDIRTVGNTGRDPCSWVGRRHRLILDAAVVPPTGWSERLHREGQKWHSIMLQRRRDGVRPDMPTAAERQEMLTAIGGKPY